MNSSRNLAVISSKRSLFYKLSIAFFVIISLSAQSLYGMINVKDYGATGDGVTNDTTSIQNALFASPDAKTVYFPAGTYMINNTLKIPDGITVKGEGNSSIIKLMDNSTVGVDPLGTTAYSVLTNSNWTVGQRNIQIKDIVIDANKSNNSQAMRGIILYNAKDALIDNVTVKNVKLYHGMFLFKMRDATISNCTVTNFDGDGICIEKSTYCVVSGNHVYEGGICGGIGIELEGRCGTNFADYRNYHITVTGNNIHNIYGHGILVIGTDWFSISSNTIYAVRANGIELLGAKFGAINGNAIGDCAKLLNGTSTRSGIKITPEDFGSGNYLGIISCSSISITGNICSYATDYGIHVEGKNGLTHSYIAISGNITKSNDKGGIKAEYVNEFKEKCNVMQESNKLILGDSVSYQTSHRTNNGTPIGLIAPYYVGEELLDTANKKWYKSTGTSDSDWVALN